MAYCPKCRSEYKLEITVCPGCGAVLVDSLGEESPVQEAPDDGGRRWKLLYCANARPAAEFLAGALESSGIKCVVKYRGGYFGRGVSYGLGAITGTADAEVWVTEVQFAEAEIIRRETVGEEDASHGFSPKK